MKYATIGSLSHGTMRPEDLIPAFLDGLEALLFQQERTPENRDELDKIRNQVEEYNDECFDDNGDYIKSEFDNEIIEDLFNMLELFSPPYVYFGSHPGDGADYGYWFNLDAIEDMPKYNDLAEVPDDIDEDYAIVNDHGNVTVYSKDGKEIVSCV